MKRYAMTYLDKLNFLCVRELWERCDGDAIEKMEFMSAKEKWFWCSVAEIPQ